MPPAKKARVEAADEGARAPSAPAVVYADNSEYLQMMGADIDAVRKKVPELWTKAALGSGDGGHLAVFDAKLLVEAFGRAEKYTCSFNICAIDLASPTPELPLSKKKRDALVAHYYQFPTEVQMDLVSLVSPDITLTKAKAMVKECKVPLAKPVEHLHAWWAAFAASCRADDGDAIKAWSTYALTTRVTFNRADNEEGNSWAAMQSRESIKVDYEVMRCTPLLRIIHFAAFKHKREVVQGKLSATKLGEQYVKQLTLAPSSEKITPSWVDMATTFVNRAFSIPAVRDALIAAEDLPAGTNPIEGTSKLQAVINKAKTPHNIQLVITMLLDRRYAGFQRSAPSLADFQGQAVDSRGKGIVDLLLYKWEVGKYLVNDWASSFIKPDLLLQIRDTMASVASYRKVIGYGGVGSVDLSFRAGWPRSAEEIWLLIESIVFDIMYDGQLKEGLKANQSPSEVMTAQFSEVIERIQTLHAAENKADGDVGPPENKESGPSEPPPPSAIDFSLSVRVKRPSVDVDSHDADASSGTPVDPVLDAARRLLMTQVQLLADTGGSDATLAEELADTRACKFKPCEHGFHDGRGYVFIIFDASNHGESSAHPHLRKPGLQQPIIDRAINVALQARNKVDTGAKTPYSELPSECLFVLFDGGRNVDSMLLKPFKDSEGKKMMTKSKFPITIMYEEESLLDNIGRVTQLGSVRCVETCSLISGQGLGVARRSHVHYKGSNFSDSIGPALVENWEDSSTWHLPRKDKIKMIGRFKIEIGGATDGASLAANSKWKTASTEPAWFHAKPYTLCDELAQSYCCTAIIDFTPHSGPWAKVAIRRRLPYVGICCSEAHVEGLAKHLLDTVAKALVDPSDSLYRSELAPRKGDNKNVEPLAKKAKAGAKGKPKDKDNAEGEGGGGGNESQSKGGDSEGGKQALMKRLGELLKKPGTNATAGGEAAAAEDPDSGDDQ